jgi:5-methylcytosine-specific restriction protein A
MAERPSARERGYTSRWDRARKAFLQRHPLCRMCEEAGLVTAARVVDHIVPHKGDAALFWDPGNWQPLCTACHSRTKQRAERGRPVQRIGPDGWPCE